MSAVLEVPEFPVEVYTDLAEVPDDTPPPDIGDWMEDGSHVAQSEALRLTSPTSFASVAPAHLIVPFTHVIGPSSRGRDVVGIKRAVYRANGLKVSAAFTPLMGPIAVRQLKEFQHRHGLGADGQVGPATLKKLGPYFDRYAFFLYEGYKPGQNPYAAARSRVLAYLLWGYNQRALIWYAQFRPMTLLADLWHLPISEDCSTFYTKAYKAARLVDPNGFNYLGFGNTTTLMQHGRRVDLNAAQIGDGVYYSSPQHVGGYVGGGRIISLGSSAGPSLTSVNYRGDYWQTRTYL